ncbi:ATP-binding protein [Fimbriiglobus ruber]|uniref:Cell division protein FtsH n=1 Tax=Fimbriiglobus ruber TaxID=1908690 RepID=A0A225E4H8_9BACT|nr:ATP-binding protein [Fimbriiglobus ruber]OWK43307.1 Cell division protein FtsH [Fimbriiglobus ruber]
MPAPDPLAALRDAAALSPDNLPLRQHLAESYRGLGRFAEAEQEYKSALARFPDHAVLKVGLAQTYYQQSKPGPALVIVEDLLKRPNTPPAATLLHARLLFQAGDVDRAVHQYKDAIATEPTLADSEFAGRLGIGADEEESEVVDGRLRAADGDGGDDVPTEVERPKITFTDVGGMEGVKDEIRLKIIHPLQHADLYKAYGKAIGGGILMYGPPGCGKTHLARATAGEVRAGFVAVGINDVLDMWMGNSERNLHQIFAQARRNKPCVLFFDEVDALAASRSDMRQSAGRMLINQFLSELDGVQTSNDGILILAATNAPWHLDSAFRRPGRFDRILFVPPPDAPARAATLRILCTGKPVKDIDYDAVAKRTDGFSGADLKGLIDVAVEAKLRAAMKTGIPHPLTTADLAAAAGKVKPSTAAWFATAKNHALYANQGGDYDDVLKYMKL